MKRICFRSFILILTWVVLVYHLGTLAPPAGRKNETTAPSLWMPKSELGLHQLVVTGTGFDRGLNAGKLTGPLIHAQERVLRAELDRIFPNALALKSLLFLLKRWFWGMDRYLESDWRDEMWGVAQSTSHEFDDLADRFTRQAAYHGLHEVGQLMVDMNPEAMACTVFGVPIDTGWVIARNFDFEGGRIFDDEKLLKWVFPSTGHAFVSVVWAGMVGVVTGVNEHGLYVSLNAAGSTDFKRLGTPSTLIVLKALQEARNVEEAIPIIQDAQLFITDIFVVADLRRMIRIEKSPTRVAVIDHKAGTVITNHLIDPQWAQDRINLFRRDDLTSRAREERGQELLLSLKPTKGIENTMANFLRDKRMAGGQLLHLGNRKAIDGLIATHAVIFHGPKKLLYVNQGPSVSGAFIGFDLDASFKERRPITKGRIGPDPDVAIQTYQAVKESQKLVSQALPLLKKRRCEEAWGILEQARRHYSDSSPYMSAMGSYYDCRGESDRAKQFWRRALELQPAYASQRKELERRVSE